MEEKAQSDAGQVDNSGSTDEKYWRNKYRKGKRYDSSSASGGFLYFLGLIGAAVYFISNAAGFWAGVVGFLKALVWPAILVYEALKHIGVA